MSEIVAVVSDLIFRTKIGSTAQALGLDVAWVASVKEFESETSDKALPPRLVLLDLEEDDELVGMVIDVCSNLAPKPTIVAYCPHVREEVLEAAKTAGIDRVMPRSVFAASLPAVLTGCGTDR